MSEILRGARYTVGVLMVLTVWTIGMMEFAQWKAGAEGREQDRIESRFAKEFEAWGPSSGDDKVEETE